MKYIDVYKIRKQTAILKKASDAAGADESFISLSPGRGRPPGYTRYPRGTLKRPADGIYTTVAGDNPSKVYTNFGVSEDRFYAANPGLRNIPANKWQVGMKVNIPIADRLHIMRTYGFDPERTDPLTDEWHNKLIMGESTFDRYMVNPDSGATGPYQITQLTLDQAKKWDPRIAGWTLKDMMDPYRAGYVHNLILRGRQIDWQYKNKKPASQETLVKLWNMSRPTTAAKKRQNDAYLEHIRKQNLQDDKVKKVMELYNIQTQ